MTGRNMLVKDRSGEKGMWRKKNKGKRRRVDQIDR